MKRTLSVNLGNRVFNIDDDAYLRLKDYLDRIEGYFSDQKEREDIISDIELRISELFTGRLGTNREVVTLPDVEEVIKVVGDPHEIGGDNEQSGNKQSHAGYERRSGPRRFYRDPDNRVIGGVCGGLGAYLDVDPVIVRIILVVLFLAFGIGFLIYLIMWIIVPEANTTAQKLEMRGDKVTASNIGQFAKDEFESVKKNFRRNRK
jgi:phage shock protein PspC (stress-responsive transcriptional regulator)